MLTIRHTLIAFAVASTLALAACNSGQDSSAANQPAATTAAVVPLTADQVSVLMTIQGAPTISADGQSVAVTVNLANNGKTTLTSSGSGPVNLGAHSTDASGKVVNIDLARAPIPDIAPNGHAVVTIQLPVDQIMGKSAQILPVQEGVAWFDTWGTKPLVVGPFNSCASAALGKVCDAAGKPLLPSTAH